MSCNRAAEIDLAGYLVDPRAAEWAAFREHLLECGECSTVLARSTRMEEGLRALGRASGHPAPELLARFAGDELAAAERGAVEAHVGGCPGCAAEVGALRRFDPAVFAMPARAPEPSGPSWWERLRGLFASPIPAPLVAVAASLLVALLVYGLARDPSQPESARMAESRSEPSPSRETPEEQIAVVDPPIPQRAVPAPAPAGDLEMAAEEAPPTPREPATTEAPPEPIEIAETQAPAEAPAAAEPELPAPDLVVASLVGMSPPTYIAPPAAAVGARFGTDVLLRSAAPGEPAPRALVPDHVGLTLSASPTLYWALSAPSSHPLEFQLLDDRVFEPVLTLRFEPPVEAGIHALRLADHGVELEADVDYRWLVTVLLDPERPASQPASGGAVKRIVPAPGLLAELESTPPAERGHLYASRSLWYDALAFSSEWIDAHPDESQLRAHRSALLEAVGLEPVDR